MRRDVMERQSKALDPNYSVAPLPDGTWAIFIDGKLALRPADGERCDLGAAMDICTLLREAAST
jgi:hypothetical protein